MEHHNEYCDQATDPHIVGGPVDRCWRGVGASQQGSTRVHLDTNKVETSIGTLEFLDGAPLPETAEKAYDFLDTMRGVDVFLKGIPAASLHALIEGNHAVGAVACHQVMVMDKLMDSKPFFLTGNTSTMYIVATLDLERDGPTVLEMPARMLGAFDDAWFRYLEDVGPAGPDKGKGGNYLVLPPGYEGDIPEGYFIVRSKTYRIWLLLRTSIANGLEPALENVKDNMRIYPLAEKNNQPKMEFISGSGKAFNTVHANDFTFYEHLNEVIQKEPLEMLDPETRGLLASIGIIKGRPFAPDARMKKILIDAVAIANATARSIVWYPRTKGTMTSSRRPGGGAAVRALFYAESRWPLESLRQCCEDRSAAAGRLASPQPSHGLLGDSMVPTSHSRRSYRQRTPQLRRLRGEFWSSSVAAYASFKNRLLPLVLRVDG